MSKPKTDNAPEAPSGDGAASRPRRELLKRLKTWQAVVLAVVLAVGAVAAALGSVLDVKDRLFGDEPLPPIGRSATFTQVDLVQTNALRHSYCRDQFKGTSLADCLAGSNSVGNLFSVGIELKGYEAICCRLEWTLKDVQSLTVPAGFREVVAVPDIEVRNPLGDIRTFTIFIPNPAQAGNYAVHFVLADRDGTIREVDSKVFQVR
jgi:hypothetical protein